MEGNKKFHFGNMFPKWQLPFPPCSRNGKSVFLMFPKWKNQFRALLTPLLVIFILNRKAAVAGDYIV